MFRIVTILLIGVLTLFSAPRAGMAHEMSGTAVTRPAQTVEAALQYGAHHHEMCPDCANRIAGAASMDMPCPHGAICVPFTPVLSLEYAVSRVIQRVGFPPMSIAMIMARAPTLDLPPPRIGFTTA